MKTSRHLELLKDIVKSPLFGHNVELTQIAESLSKMIRTATLLSTAESLWNQQAQDLVANKEIVKNKMGKGYKKGIGQALAFEFDELYKDLEKGKTSEVVLNEVEKLIQKIATTIGASKEEMAKVIPSWVMALESLVRRRAMAKYNTLPALSPAGKLLTAYSSPRVGECIDLLNHLVPAKASKIIQDIEHEVDANITRQR